MGCPAWETKEVQVKEDKLEEALQSVRKAFSKSDRKIGILYSGGKDSSAVLLTIAKEFPDAELYLYALNNGCMYPEEIKNKIKEKLELFASSGLVRNKMTAMYFDVREPMAYLGFRPFHDDMHTYPTGLLCCTCKLCMHVATAKYSSGIGLTKIADGYSKFERFLPEQLPEFKRVITGDIRQQYGVEFISPLYDVFDAADAPMKILKGFGLSPDIFLGEKLGQAVCLLGRHVQDPLRSQRVRRDQERLLHGTEAGRRRLHIAQAEDDLRHGGAEDHQT